MIFWRILLRDLTLIFDGNFKGAQLGCLAKIVAQNGFYRGIGAQR